MLLYHSKLMMPKFLSFLFLIFVCMSPVKSEHLSGDSFGKLLCFQVQIVRVETVCNTTEKNKTKKLPKSAINMNILLKSSRSILKSVQIINKRSSTAFDSEEFTSFSHSFILHHLVILFQPSPYYHICNGSSWWHK